MVKRLVFILLVTFVSLPSLKAQEEQGFLLPAIVIEGDTLFLLDIRTANVTARAPSWLRRQWREHYRLVYNLKRVYPYTQIAKRKLKEMNDHFLTLTNEKERKAYVKQMEKDMFAEFEGPLRKLTRSQGKMLIKLIDRETGISSFEVVKELKGGFSAFFWQNIARLFGANLKAKYDPEGDDRILEDLVRMCEIGTFDELYYSMYNE